MADEIDHEHEQDPVLDSDALERSLDEALAGASKEIAPVTEADVSFYTRVLNACSDGINTIDKQLEDINGQAQRLLESKKKLTADRQRLATQRSAARISMRYLEDSEAKRQGSGS